MISPRASASGLPCSDVMISARSSAFATIRSYQARRSFARSWLVRFCQACWASADAAMACSTSAAPRLATRDVTRGRIRDGNDRPSVPSAHPDASHARVSSNAPSRSWARSTEGSIAWFVLLCISFTSTVSRNSCFSIRALSRRHAKRSGIPARTPAPSPGISPDFRYWGANGSATRKSSQNVAHAEEVHDRAVTSNWG